MRHRVRTSDGRHLMVERLGDPHGRPVFLLHGTPGCRLGPAPRGMVLYQRRTQLIAYDRPGYGGSDRLPGRSVADVARDVRDIADELGLDRFAVVGRSGGAPHALACAALLPERVTRAAALVTLAPRDAAGLDWFEGMAASNVLEYTFASDHPDVLTERFILRSAQIREDPIRLLNDLRKELTESDRMVVQDAGVRGMLLRNYQEALRTSAYGWIDDALAFSSPWGFDPADIKAPVMLWHGEKDVFSPVGHSRWLAERIPGATAVLEPSAAHFDALHALPRALTWLVEE
ncbi:alpha/beta fold hydrolase [Streptomyces clavuligerus]|uniref:alpha/beta fold hydrolase n=1 Tax=Streptomyces clavuligerus TaxID=1901 RepID=UPI000997C279|nr:alpha/beta hydrolase [Streptomyces clavuligerus]AXU15540.1 alpha/beta hydrolase [Streptomyces clavuligerus]MBY6305646.1 alpha/beta hydrolase [Streptomyces clavuligerus]QCS08318.1 alpha/beta hydrolase [Streptomyces clavuligerus]QPJ92348.1 alpha/beta fold hydrolase [Streptomyces clavuligerus]QPL65536.1 alpha/beta hydrolase [Streptomyces clavuligerus]